MTGDVTPSLVPSKGFGAENWMRILEGAGLGAQKAFESAAGYASSKREAKEAKRRTLVDMLVKAQQRKSDVNRMQRDYGNEAADYKAKALQQMARGFIDAVSRERIR